MVSKEIVLQSTSELCLKGAMKEAVELGSPTADASGYTTNAWQYGLSFRMFPNPTHVATVQVCELQLKPTSSVLVHMILL